MTRALAVAIAVLCGCQHVFGLDEPTRADSTVDLLVPQAEWDAVAIGLVHTCAIARDDQTLWCFGDNQYGQVGVGSTSTVIGARTQVGTGTWSSIALGALHTCGIQTDRTLWCWGHGFAGKLGVGTETDALSPMQVTGEWRRVVVGDHHTCAITIAGELRCWGLNADGQIGDGSATWRMTPTPVLATTTWIDISAGLNQTCGIREDGALLCWGANLVGQLGDTGPNTSTPRMVHPGPWVEVVAASLTGCARSASNHLYCWGDNGFGSLGRAENAGLGPIAPVLDNGVDRDDWSAIRGASSALCGLRANGEALCWGYNYAGAFGADTIVRAPVPIASDTRVLAPGYHTCRIDAEHHLSCAGLAGSGELGDGARNQITPTRVTGTWTRVDTGLVSTCALSPGGEPFCSGLGLVGNGSSVPQQVLTGTGDDRISSTVATGAFSRCAAGTDGVWCWGHNPYGDVGDGSRVPRASPVLVRSGAHREVDSSLHTCAIANDRTLTCWGRNASGEIGNQTSGSDVLSPTIVPGLWDQVTTARAHTCAVTSGGLSCWGDNTYGQLGDGTQTMRTVPSALIVGSYTDISGGDAHTCAITTSNALSCWGNNAKGQLGLGDSDPRLSPTPLPGQWKDVSAGGFHTCAVAADSTLWCWGYNRYGQAGIGSLLDTKLPTRVGSDTDWAAVSAGTSFTCALKADSSLWCWGANTWGQLADGRAWRSTFEPVP